jgi:hypothetical protein
VSLIKFLILYKKDNIIVSEILLNRKFIDMMKLLNIYLNHFPNHEKHALCQQIRQTAYTLYDLIIEGEKRYFKKSTLTNLDITHQKLRMQIKLAYDLGYFSYKHNKKNNKVYPFKKFSIISNRIDEIGRLIGSWIKIIKQNENWK